MSANFDSIAKSYHTIEEKMIRLRDTLSTSMFIILLICFLNVYNALSTGLFPQQSRYSRIELTITTCLSVVIVLLLNYFCVNVSEYMLELKTSIGSLIDKCNFNDLRSVKKMFLLYRIEKKDVIYLTACGAIQFKRGFFLSFMGALFTSRAFCYPEPIIYIVGADDAIPCEV
ncbi:uncharacterized protein CDAR_219891 [Caerostris darwini]|uniref:Uncharacterized protein n=1 Tax=Caerostris darwini TaxID=1538125 RepID=A0AAV4VHR2_9ARAC|nr:uncharacterized protein CDAR_219891 [Caerostris darwini]